MAKRKTVTIRQVDEDDWESIMKFCREMGVSASFFIGTIAEAIRTLDYPDYDAEIENIQNTKRDAIMRLLKP